MFVGHTVVSFETIFVFFTLKMTNKTTTKMTEVFVVKKLSF